jgi:hypothetical protein
MDLWAVKHASCRSRIGDLSGDSSVRGARIRGVGAGDVAAQDRATTPFYTRSSWVLNSLHFAMLVETFHHEFSSFTTTMYYAKVTGPKHRQQAILSGLFVDKDVIYSNPRMISLSSPALCFQDEAL